jgi:hypothetical protein
MVWPRSSKTAVSDDATVDVGGGMRDDGRPTRVSAYSQHRLAAPMY